MGNIDLDARAAARAAAREGKNEGPTVTFKGQTWTLPVEMPFDIVEHVARLQRGQLSAIGSIFAVLMGSEAFEELHALKPSLDDMMELVDGILEEYGLGSVGESPASGS